MRCPRCQFENPPTMHFCFECGAETQPTFQFCGQCGAPLGTLEPPSEPAPMAKALVYQRQEAKLQSYTPRHLVEKILTARSALEGERRQISVLFADPILSPLGVGTIFGFEIRLTLVANSSAVCGEED